MSEIGRTVAIVQARLGSTRLPRKVLMPLAGSPMVVHVLRRSAAIEGVEEVMAAIPDLSEDDELADVIGAAGFRVFRGSEADVLARYVAAASASGADTVVRITSDCPLLSPGVSSRIVAAFADCDYVSNTIERTYPRGLDTEVVAMAALEAAHREADTPAEREHVTPYVWRHIERFRVRQVVDDMDRSGLRWTVDTNEDLAFATAVYDALGSSFEFEGVLEFLEHRPDLVALNRDVEQKTVR